MRISCIIYSRKKEVVNARVTIIHREQRVKLKKSRKNLGYYADIDCESNDPFTFLVEKKGFEKLEQLAFASEETFELILGEKGMNYMRKGTVKVPIQNYSGLYAINGQGEEFEKLLNSLGLERVKEYKGEIVQSDSIYRKKKSLLKGLKKAEVKRLFAADMETLNRSKLVSAAGPVSELSKNDDRTLTNQVKMGVVDGVREAKLKGLLRENGFEVIRKNRNNEFIVSLGGNGDAAYLAERMEVLYGLQIAKYILPVSISNPNTDVAASNFLAKGQYSHNIMKVEEAWSALQAGKDSMHTFGIGDVLVCVVDDGLVPFAGDQNPSFTVDVQKANGDMEQKIYKLFDFRPASFGNDNDEGKLRDGVVSTHGVNVAGVICAAEQAIGTAGVAPNTQVMSLLVFDISDDLSADALGWAGGLNDYDNLGDFVSKINRGFDVLASSISYNYLSSVDSPDMFRQLIDNLAIYGRNGRGAIMVFSAGNENEEFTFTAPTPGSPKYNRYSTYDGVLSIGGTSFFNDYPTERKVTYANTGKIDFCAPTSNGGGSSVHDPAKYIRTWTSTIIGRGDLPGDNVIEKTIMADVLESNPVIQDNAVLKLIIPSGGAEPDTSLSAAVNPGDPTITVNDPAGFMSGMFIEIKKNSTVGPGEYVKITSVSGSTLTIDPTTPIVGTYSVPASTSVDGFAHFEVGDTTPYMIGMKLACEKIQDGQTVVKEFEVHFTSGINVIVRNPLSHFLEIDDVVTLRKKHELAGGYLDPAVFIAGYAPTGSPTLDINIDDGTITIANEEDFEPSTLIHVETAGGDSEWLLINTITPGSPGTLNLHSKTKALFDHAAGSTTITGYPSLDVFTEDMNFAIGEEVIIAESPESIFTTLRGYIYNTAAFDPVATTVGTGSTQVEIAQKIVLNNVSGISVGDTVLIDKPEFEYDEVMGASSIKEKSEIVKVLKVLAGSNTIVVDKILKDHIISGGDTIKIYKGDLDYDSSFGGTSSACPSTAGVIALMLSANPDLTKPEIIELLRLSADKIDPNNRGYILPVKDSLPFHVSSDGKRPEGQGRWRNKAGEYIYETDGTTPTPGVVDTVPYSSEWYGYGRINAKNAVDLALAYSQNDRDLVIRDSLVDDGTSGNPTDIAVNSPDVWVRNIDPGDEVIDFNLISYAAEGPHMKPMKDTDRHIYARIKNIGTVEKSLEAKVRFFIVLTNPGTQFKFPDHYTEYGDVASGIAGVKMVGEVAIAAEDIDPSGVKVVSVPWPKDFSDVNTGLETNILVQVSPHDGPIFGVNDDGLLVGNCNNLTRKKIVFREEIEITDLSGGGLVNSIAIPSDSIGSVITTDFAVDISEAVLFTSEDVKIKMTYKLHGSPAEEVEFRYDTGTWDFDTAPTGSWTTLNAPLIEPFGVADLATLDQNNIRFTGSFDVNGDVDYVKIQCDYSNVDGNTRTKSKTVDVRVEYIADGTTDFDPIEKNKIYFFTEFPLLIYGQAYSDVFGPDNSTPDTVFRTTNKFWTDIDAKAFAVTTGQILVVPTADSAIVNVVLKPRNQGSIDFLDVKYFVYRGILKEELIDNSDPQLVAPEAGANAFVASIWDTQKKINEAIENADDGDAITPGSVTDDPSALALGVQYVYPATEIWHVEKLDGESIDQLFYDEASDYKFPIVKAGDEFGKFRDSSIGFDIILNSSSSVTTFGDVRGTEHTITVSPLGGSPTPLDELEDRRNRAKVLEYMDPAAFYGIHYYSGINAHDGGGADTLYNSKDTNNAYDSIISNFLNKNRTYIDIRNENGYSFNYYDNYTNSGADIKLSFDGAVSPTTEMFGTSGWPLRIVENSELETGEVGKKNAIYMELPKGDNAIPLLHKSHAHDFKRFPKKPKNSKRFQEVEFDGANLYSETVKLGIPNREDNGDTTAVAWYVRLNYIKRNLGSNPASSGMVINGINTFDHIFPVEDHIKWNSSNQILFNAGFQSRYFERPDFSCYGELGFAKESDRVIFYMTPEDVNFQPSKDMRLYKRVLGGVSNKTSFFEAIQNTFPDFSLRKGELTVGGSSVFYLNYTDGSMKKKRETDKFNFICIGITKVEYDSLLASATASSIDSDLHSPLIVVKTKTVLSDDDGKGYVKYELGVAGLDTGGNYVVAPATVVAYSVDNLMLTSSSFADEETSTDTDSEDCIEFVHNFNYDMNTTFGRVVKRVSLFKQTDGTIVRKWKMYTAAGDDLMYENTDVSNFGDPLNDTIQIELPVGARVIMLECKVLPVETLGSLNYIRVVTYYNGNFREGYISENAIRNSTDERTLRTENVTADEQFDMLINDIKLDTVMARRITLDPTRTQYDFDTNFTDLLTSLEEDFDPSNSDSLVSKYGTLSETEKQNWMAGLKSVESKFRFNYYEDDLKGFRIDYPATSEKYMEMINEIQPLHNTKMDGITLVKPLLLPFTADWGGFASANKPGYNETIANFFIKSIQQIPGDTSGDNGSSYDKPDTEMDLIIAEFKKIRKFLNQETVDDQTISPDDPVLQTKEARWFLDPAHDDAFFDSITDVFFVWDEAWKNDFNPGHLTTDFRAGYIGVDNSLGFFNSNNVFTIFAHELNNGDSNILRIADDTHTYPSQVKISFDGYTDQKYVSQTAWEFVKEYGFDDFNGHGFYPLGSYVDGDGKEFGNSNYSASKHVCDFLHRNPSIGVIYAGYIFNKLKSL